MAWYPACWKLSHWKIFQQEWNVISHVKSQLHFFYICKLPVNNNTFFLHHCDIIDHFLGCISDIVYSWRLCLPTNLKFPHPLFYCSIWSCIIHWLVLLQHQKRYLRGWPVLCQNLICSYGYLSSLQKSFRKILDSSKLKEFADNNFQIDEYVGSFPKG